MGGTVCAHGFISLHHRFRVCVFIHFTLTTVPCGVAGVTGVLFPHSSTETWVQTDAWLELGAKTSDCKSSSRIPGV